MIARVGVIVVALVVLGWLVVLERDQRLNSSGFEISKHLRQADNAACARSTLPPSACKEFRRAVDDFHGATFLNPDTQPALSSVLLAHSGQPRRQAADVESLLRKEPDNLAAWVTLESINLGRHDSAGIQQARRALRRLDPLDFAGS